MPLNDLGRRTATLRPQLDEAFARVLDRGWYLVGPEVEAFEREFAEFLGVGHCVGLGNGTDALRLALGAAGVGAGDEVVTAANAGGYASVAIRALGALPRFADIDAATHCIAPESAAAVLNAETKAVVVTHLYGRIGEVEAIAELCRARGVTLIEDCAQAAGARLGGRAAGQFGDLAAFSFYPTKNLGALGDAGAVTTASRDLASRVRRLAQYGWNEKYTVEERGGINSRLDELQAAALRVGLPRLDRDNHRRRAIAARFAAAVSPEAGALLQSGDPARFVAHLAVLLVGDRDDARLTLLDRGVQTGIHYPVPDHLQPAWRDEHATPALPETEHAAKRVLTLPCFPEMTAAEVEQVAAALEALGLSRP